MDLLSPRSEPARTCVACREEAGKATMLRVVRRAEGGAVVDRTGRAQGRGAYLHNAAECIETARKKKALDRALKTQVGPEIWAELAL
jgi:predicted RNA-binding protein YlxR (DUF448 family)